MTDLDIEYRRHFQRPIAVLVDELTKSLGKRGFGVLSNLNLKNIIKQKLGEDIDDYVVLDVCSPAHALRAIRSHKEAGLVLPCKIIAYLDNHETILSLYRPTSAVGISETFSDLFLLAEEVEEQLKESMNELPA